MSLNNVKMELGRRKENLAVEARDWEQDFKQVQQLNHVVRIRSDNLNHYKYIGLIWRKTALFLL